MTKAKRSQGRDDCKMPKSPLDYKHINGNLIENDILLFIVKIVVEMLLEKQAKTEYIGTKMRFFIDTFQSMPNSIFFGV